MSTTKIINVLKSDSLEEILDALKVTSAKEVIFVLPKKSKAFSTDRDFKALSDEASRSSKSISLLCSNHEVNQRAREYGFDVLMEGQGKIDAVNQYSEDGKAGAFDEIPPWGERELPGVPVEDIDKSRKSKPAKSAKPKPKIKLNAKPRVILGESQSPDYRLVHAVKIRRVEDIISPIKDGGSNIEINKAKEKASIININRHHVSDEESDEILKEMSGSWEEKQSGIKPSSIWSDWGIDTKDKLKPKKLKKFKFKFPTIGLAGFKLPTVKPLAFVSLGIVVFLGIVIFSYGGSAKITIHPTKKPIDLVFKISASDKYSSVNDLPDKLTAKIPGQVFTVQKEISQKFDASGQKDAVQKARGKLTIYNETDVSQALVTTTRFESETKLVYRTLTSVVVPAAKVKSGQTVPGTVDVDIIADKAGPEYNTSSTAKFGVVAFREKNDLDKSAHIYGKLSEAIRGGINGKSTIVSDTDYNAAKDTLIQQLTKELNDSLKSQTLQFKIVYSSGVDAADPISTSKPDDTATNFDMKISASIKTIGFKESDLFEVIGNYAEKDGGRIVLPEKLEISYQKVYLDKVNNVLEFQAQVKGNEFSKIDPDTFVDNLVGKKEQDLRDYLAANADIESAKVVLAPFWIKKVPADTNRIKFDIEY